MRKPLIAGNWKMYKTPAEAEAFIQEFLKLPVDLPDREVLICAPFTDLFILNQYCKGKTDVKVGAQNVYYETEGAYTGEISAAMLKDIGCSYVIVGHSERRQIFGETNAMIRRKIEAVLNAGLKGILCVGETLTEREAGQAEAVIKEELLTALKGLAFSEGMLTIAYEPIWAIGTGKTASDEDAESMAAFIRSLLKTLYNEEIASQVRILYGGSVKPATIDSLMKKPNVDGALVGGASLKPDDFARIVRFE